MADQLICEAQRQVGKRADVDGDHAELVVTVALDGVTEHAETGVIDQILNLDAFSRQRGLDGVAGVDLFEIAGDDDRRRTAGCGDFPSELVQTIGTARRQHNTMTVRGKNPRQFHAYAR